MELSNLPHDIRGEIGSHLDVRDLGNLSSTSTGTRSSFLVPYQERQAEYLSYMRPLQRTKICVQNLLADRRPIALNDRQAMILNLPLELRIQPDINVYTWELLLIWLEIYILSNGLRGPNGITLDEVLVDYINSNRPQISPAGRPAFAPGMVEKDENLHELLQILWSFRHSAMIRSYGKELVMTPQMAYIFCQEREELLKILGHLQRSRGSLMNREATR